MDKWCEHITYKDRSFKFPDESGFRFHLSSCDITIDGWKQCPICAAPRPKENKLVDILRNHSSASYQSMAQAAIDAVIKVIDNYFNKELPNLDIYRDELKTELRKLL